MLRVNPGIELLLKFLERGDAEFLLPDNSDFLLNQFQAISGRIVKRLALDSNSARRRWSRV
jgi:hypothetical protein